MEKKLISDSTQNTNNMKYKVILGGRGADVFIHQIDDEQKQKLKEMDVENTSVVVDWDKLNEVLKVENWDYTDESYVGVYPTPEAYYITVFDENDELVFESDQDFYMDQGEEDDDYKFIEKENVLLIEHILKGNFKEYLLDIEEPFNPEKLTFKMLDFNEEVELIVDLKYDNKELELEEWGDNWSKGTYFYIL